MTWAIRGEIFKWEFHILVEFLCCAVWEGTTCKPGATPFGENTAKFGNLLSNVLVSRIEVTEKLSFYSEK